MDQDALNEAGNDSPSEPASDLSSHAPKIAYLVYAHQHFEQLHTLIKAMDSPAACFIIHIDKKAGNDRKLHSHPAIAALMKMPRVSFLEPRQDVRWGAYSLTEVSLRALKMALDIPSVIRFRSLSGLDFPIRPTQEIENKLLRNPETNYITGVEPHEWWIRNRTEQYWNIDTFGAKRLSHYFALAQKLLGVRRKPPSGLTVMKGSQWWSLNRDAVSYILEFIDSRPDVERFFRRASVSDESMIQSVLHTSPLWKTVIQDNQTFFRFQHKSPNPDTLDTVDLAEVMSSGKLFARKFDTSGNPEILNIIEQQRHQNIE